jgi:hypothetical protein
MPVRPAAEPESGDQRDHRTRTWHGERTRTTVERDRGFSDPFATKRDAPA